LIRADIEREYSGDEFTLIVIPEDIPPSRTADEVVARLFPNEDAPTWMRWGTHQPPRQIDPGERLVVLFEGFDRQLGSLPPQERRELRRRVADHNWLLVTTGIGLGPTMTGRDEAFYGAFDPWPIAPLTDPEADEMLDRLVAGVCDTDAASWVARKEAIVSLAGGNARALLALAIACRNDPENWVTDHLHRVLGDCTAHYQMRLRDLSPQAQRIVETIAEAPRELTPSEMARWIGTSASQMSVQASRLVDDGVLHRRTEGRNSWYSIAEPMFRYWLEYRLAPWEDTRIEWLSRLLGAVLSPVEVAQSWWMHPEPEMRRVLEAVLERDDIAGWCAWMQLSKVFFEAAKKADHLAVDEVFRRIGEVPPDPRGISQFVLRVAMLEPGRIDAEVVAIARASGLAPLAGALEMSIDLRDGCASPRDRFFEWVCEAADSLPTPPGLRDLGLQWLTVEWVVKSALETQHWSDHEWRPSRRERMDLAKLPSVRALFLLQGCRSGERPFLEPEDILSSGIGPDSPDLSRLLDASWARRSDHLVEKILDSAMDQPDTMLPLSPRPAHPCPIRSEAIVEIMIRGLERFHALGFVPALSWAATLTEADEDALTRLVALIEEKQPPLLPEFSGGERARAAVALTSLALASPSRYAMLTAALGERWNELTTRVDSIAAQLREHRGGVLHRELERLWQAMVGS